MANVEQSKPFYKNWKLLIFIGVVITCLILFIANETKTPVDENSYKKENGKVKDRFEVETSKEKNKSKEEIYREKVKPKGVKDIDLDEYSKNEIKPEEDTENNNINSTQKPALNKVYSKKELKKNTVVYSNTNLSKNNNVNNSKILSDTTKSKKYISYNSETSGSTWVRGNKTNNSGNVSFKSVVFGDNLITGSTGICKIRILEDIYLQGDKIPRNTILAAKVTRSTDYIYLTIEEIEFNSKIYKSNFYGYTNNGKGIYHKSELVRNNLKRGAGEVISNTGSLPLPGSNVVSSAGKALTKSAQESVELESVTIQDGFELLFMPN